MEVQCAMGVSTFLIDLWEDDNDIYLLHQSNTVLDLFSQNSSARRARLRTTLDLYKSLLDKFPQLVLTIVIEDKLGDSGIRDRLPTIFNEAGVESLRFDPRDRNLRGWNWPTLNEMIASNKRLVVHIKGRTIQRHPRFSPVSGTI
jgi:hypothetical protein